MYLHIVTGALAFPLSFFTVDDIRKAARLLAALAVEGTVVGGV